MNPVENKAIFQTLAGIADNQPLVRIAIKYWWLAIPGSLVMYYRLRKRPRIDLGGVVEDFGFSFGPIIPLIMLSEMLVQKTPPSVVPAIASAPIKDAQFQMATPAVTQTPQPFPS
jgi:hypothetical protein